MWLCSRPGQSTSVEQVKPVPPYWLARRRYRRERRDPQNALAAELASEGIADEHTDGQQLHGDHAQRRIRGQRDALEDLRQLSGVARVEVRRAVDVTRRERRRIVGIQPGDGRLLDGDEHVAAA